jgi:hypothetical protein
MLLVRLGGGFLFLRSGYVLKRFYVPGLLGGLTFVLARMVGWLRKTGDSKSNGNGKSKSRSFGSVTRKVRE